MRVRVVVGVIGAALLVAGCGSGTVSGKADAQGVGPGEPVFSPCDDIPADALRAVGVDPATESRDVLGVKQPGWNVCKWHGDGPYLSVYATAHSLDDVRANKRNTDFNPVDIGGRAGFSYRELSDRERRSCDVSIGSGGGAVLVSVADLDSGPMAEDPCAIAVRSARELVKYFPL